LEASLDAPEQEESTHEPDANGASNTTSRSHYTLTSLSEIESTLQELASDSTPSKEDISVDQNYNSPYSTPTHNNNLNTSRSSPYSNFSSNSNRTNTPLPSQTKPPVQRTQSDLPKASPKLTTPTSASTLKKTASPKVGSSNSSFSHSFAAAFDPSSNPSSPTSPAPASAIPDSPKIRSKLVHSTIHEEPEDQPQLETPQEEGPTFTSISISSLTFDYRCTR
jgi:hypothetical protein